NEDTHAFSGENGGTQGIGKKVDVENGDALDAGNFIEIEVVGNDLGLKAQGEFDKVVINFAGLTGNFFDNSHFVRGQLLDALKHFKPTTAALTAQAVRRVGDGLQLVQDKTGNEKRSIQKMCFADVGYAAVDQDAGVEKFTIRMNGRGAWPNA